MKHRALGKGSEEWNLWVSRRGGCAGRFSALADEEIYLPPKCRKKFIRYRTNFIRKGTSKLEAPVLIKIVSKTHEKPLNRKRKSRLFGAFKGGESEKGESKHEKCPSEHGFGQGRENKKLPTGGGGRLFLMADPGDVQRGLIHARAPDWQDKKPRPFLSKKKKGRSFLRCVRSGGLYKVFSPKRGSGVFLHDP